MLSIHRKEEKNHEFGTKIQEGKFLSNEILELQDEAKKHLANSKAENTKRAYRNDWIEK